MKYRYFQLRDKAWQLLVDSKIDKLPVDLNKILKFIGINAFPYSFNDGIRGAVATLNNSTKAILYSNSSNEQQARFSIAHEIGHLYLKHKIKPSTIEKEANSFAARLLMPLGILYQIKVNSAEEIAHVCNVTLESAKWRAKRIELVQNRNKYFTSALERKLIIQFKKFIKEYKYNI